MQIEGTPLSLDDSLLYDQFEKDLKFLQLFLLLVNHSCPIKRVELVWAGDGPAGRVGLRQKFLSTEQALAGPCAHLLASKHCPEPLFCYTVNDYGRHEAESCSISDRAAEGRVRATGRPEVYRCHAGLVDIAVPVICDGRHLATLFTGQVLIEPPSDEGFAQILQDTAALTYVDRAKLYQTYQRVPVVSESDIQRTVQVLEIFAEYLATTWKRLGEIVRDQRRKQRELNLDKKEFCHLVLEGNLTDQSLVRQLITRIGLTRYPNRVMVVKIDSDTDDHSKPAVFDLLFARAVQAIEELCDHMQNVCCTYLRSKSICIFFRHQEHSESSPSRSSAADSFARRVLEAVSRVTPLKARVGIGTIKSALSELTDSYHEACSALTGFSSPIATYRPLLSPDEELSVAVGRICVAIADKRVLNARMLVSALPLLVNKKLGDRTESLLAQCRFFSYVIDAIVFAAHQLGSDRHDGGQDHLPDKHTLETAATIFDLQEAFICSAGAVLDAVWRMLGGRPRKIVDRARAMIDAALDDRHTAQQLSIPKIASGLGISAGHLSRMFRQVTGVTLERHLMIRRVEKAKCLLLEPFENVSDIAEKCGFSDPAYFARVFRKVAGMSPREYRDDPMRITDSIENDWSHRASTAQLGHGHVQA